MIPMPLRRKREGDPRRGKRICFQSAFSGVLFGTLLLCPQFYLRRNPSVALALPQLLDRQFVFKRSQAPVSQSFVKNMATWYKNRGDETSNGASALRELKDTIENQSVEIAQLKSEIRRQKSPSAAPSHGHGHGGGEIEEDIHGYLERPFLSLAFHRVGWLAIFLVSLSLTAIIMNGFEHTLSRQIELAYFVPLLAGHGGNTGGQTVGTVLAAMSAGEVKEKDAFRVIAKESMSGLAMGSMLGLVVGAIVHFVMGISSHVSTVLALTIPPLSAVASILGSGLPFICLWLGLDPTVIAAPAMTSFVDITGLLCYFLIANQIFHLWGLEL